MSYPDTEAPKTAKGGSLMEDVISIFYNPTAVFEHQRNKSFVMPALIQMILFAAIAFGMRNLIQPFWDAESARQMAAQAAKMAAAGQTMPPEARAAGEKFSGVFTIVFIVLAPWLTALVGGLFTWLASKIVSVRLTYGQSATIASWAGFPAVLGLITTAIFGVVKDPATIRGVTDGQLGFGQLLDPNTASRALVALAQNTDVFAIWTFVLSAIGISVIARAPQSTGFVAAAIKWGIVIAFAVVPAILF